MNSSQRDCERPVYGECIVNPCSDLEFLALCPIVTSCICLLEQLELPRPVVCG